MSLLTRLVLTLVGLLVLGLGLAVGATFGALQDWRGNQNNDVLSSVGRQLAHGLTSGPAGEARLVAPPDLANVTSLWRSMAEHGDVPSFFQLRAADGRTVRTVAFGVRPHLPDPLPAALWPGSPTGDNRDGESFRPVGTDGEAQGPNWLVRTAVLPDRRILLVAMRTTSSDELLGRTANAALISSVAALLAVALLSVRAIRRGLRPLQEMADTAAAIGQGEWSRRVERAEHRTEVGRLGLVLNAMLGQIESAFAKRQESEDRLRRFVADASHELRTPLASIRGYAELFRRGAANRPDDLAKAMTRIEAEAERMGSLVDELLFLARLDQGLPLECEPVDLSELAADAVADAHVIAPDRSVSLCTTGPVVVRGDAPRLRQVLANLLSNVLHHTPEGTPAEVRVHRSQGHGVIEVADSGPGLTAEEAEHVFERFFRIDGSRSRRGRETRDGEGSGLGLSIVAAVAAAHGGDVAASATPGEGATFRVRLPVDRKDCP